MSQNMKKTIRGIRISTVSYVMIFLSIVLYLVLFFANNNVSKEYEVTVTATEDYIKCDAQVAELLEGSNYLTQQVQFYVISGKTEYAQAYFEEVNVRKRRNRALKALEEYKTVPHTYGVLEETFAYSNQLMERELYAIKLTALSQGADLQKFPKVVQNLVLNNEDRKLNAEQMQEKARALIFDASYQDTKTLIANNITHFVNEIISYTYKNQQQSFSALNKTIISNKIYLSVLFLLNLVTFAFIVLLIIKPLQKHIHCIKDERRLDIVGSYEFKYLAQTYNDIYELKASHEALLKKRAEHDALTGLINRGAFEQIKQLFAANPVSLAFLIIDVDNFKRINDKYGHEVGDQILKKAARAIKGSFRSNDYPARIGGDEFAAILTNITVNEKEAVRRKVERMNEILMNPTDDLPPVSLSVGGAFSEQGFVDELFACADRALYVVKEKGRCGCRFYEELDE